METTWEAIERAAEAGDIDRVAELCLALDEPGRERLTHRAAALARRLDTGRWNDPVPRGGQTARFGLGPPLPDTGHEHFEPPSSHLEAGAPRPRAWRDAWVRWVGVAGTETVPLPGMSCARCSARACARRPTARC